MYKVQYQANGSAMWITAGSAGSEHSAIVHAKSVANRPNVDSVRVLDPDGYPVWFG